ncbi:MAG: AAA family ATPase [Shewanella xiamenensis]|uniref:AAA family ATPase n=2 Tax=Shewanella TaxID=22 RepID=A0AAE4TNC9_9GAMM|nr:MULTISPECIES: AAA family ATPase [Shewanella]MCD8549881.1 AAA family ATPase [Shewanella xiamenensis]MCD8558234.1 AAA family ATPase [Shewanella xiamenensis]MCK7657686.1 AAA family ATPase [Shewanella sp. JNE4-2]MCT8858104.1 AAA family ATPase [Shewanella xiamenensis]MDH0451006.1 AAA family ATPase [Shewanella sp. GD04112]
MATEFLSKINVIADRAKIALQTMSNAVQSHKDEFGLNEFYLSFTKGVVSQLSGLNRRSVEKAMAEMEANGYEFGRKKIGAVEGYDFSIEQVIDIYKHRGFAPLRDKYAEGLVLFFSNLKGGVSKTLSTVSIAQSLRCHRDLLQYDIKCLVLDIDPQSSATMYLNQRSSIGEIDNTVVQAVFNDVSREQLLSDFVLPSQVPGVDIIPASIADGFIAAEWESICKEQFGDDFNPYEALYKNVIQKLKGDYDFIFIDAGPHLDAALKAGLCASDILVTPLPPSRVDMHSTLQYISNLPSILNRLIENGAELRLKGHLAFMTKFSQSAQDIDSSILANSVFAEDFMMSSIPELSAFKRCAETFDTVISVHPSLYGGAGKSLANAKDALDSFSLALFQHVSRLR